MKIEFTIPVIPRTKKNSQQIIIVNHKPTIVQSKAYRMYEKKALPLLPIFHEPIKSPINLSAAFYMPTRRRVDLVNLLQGLCDLLVKGNVLADDNSKIVVSMDGSRVLYDKNNPRTEVTIEDVPADTGR